jgi:hypothetical protein
MFNYDVHATLWEPVCITTYSTAWKRTSFSLHIANIRNVPIYNGETSFFFFYTQDEKLYVYFIRYTMFLCMSFFLSSLPRIGVYN